MLSTLWLQLGGNEYENKRLGIPELGYPLCYNTPFNSWNYGNDMVLWPYTKRYAICIDILVEICQYTKKIPENEVSKYLFGYRYCIGIADLTIGDTIVNPSERDTITALYYARFPEGYNKVSKLFPYDFHNSFILPKNVEVIIQGEKRRIAPSMIHKPTYIVAFLSSFTTLNPGDLVSVGCFCYWEQPDLQRLAVRLEEGRLLHEVTIMPEVP